MATAHAKNRAPSAAHRWLSCPQSAFITPMYPNDETDASLKGDYWHSLMEDRIVFGSVPKSADPDAAEAMEDLADYVLKRFKDLGGKLYVEQQLGIPETGEFGTADIIIVSDREIEIIDEKSGYVPVDAKMNFQMMVYLLGAIAKYGERKKYRLTIHQPNYDHIDGPIRHYEPTQADIDWLRQEIKYSIANEDSIKAGKHCKKTYCPHRGACTAFHNYVGTDLLLGWHPHEVRSIGDDDLARALDAADQLSGYRNELRAEAMRRIMNSNREIEGYKVVKGRRNREVSKPEKLVRSVADHMGDKWAIMLFPSLSWLGAEVLDDIISKAPIPEEVLKSLGTAKHIEDVIKIYAREHNLPRGGWKAIYDNVVADYIRETANGLTLEKSIDGRPSHKRGSEFGAIQSPATETTII